MWRESKKGSRGNDVPPSKKNRVIYTRMCSASIGVAQNRGTNPTHFNVWLVFVGGNGVIALHVPSGPSVSGYCRNDDDGVRI